MPTRQAFETRVTRLRADLVEQGHRVQTLVETAFESVFARDETLARRAIDADDVIDRTDVDIERASVVLLTDASVEATPIGPEQLRAVLVIVKVNNEMERIADAGVSIAEQVPDLIRIAQRLPETFRVMANSAVGIVRDVDAAFDRMDAPLARVVLQSEEAVEAFKKELLRDSERQIAVGTMTVEFAFALHEIAAHCERMVDYCTNIAEQIIYATTGAVVRHTEGRWVDADGPGG